MNKVSGYRKFMAFMMKSSLASFGLGILALSCSRGFGPCGPSDISGALGFLACLLGMAGGLVFFVPFVLAD